MAATAWLEWKTTAVAIVAVALIASSPLSAKSDETKAEAHPPFATLHIPHLEKGPTLNDFLGMQASPEMEGKMLKVEGFQQRDPKDGAPISQKTEAYLGYTDKNLYVVAICFETELR